MLIKTGYPNLLNAEWILKNMEAGNSVQQSLSVLRLNACVG